MTFRLPLVLLICLAFAATVRPAADDELQDIPQPKGIVLTVAMPQGAAKADQQRIVSLVGCLNQSIIAGNRFSMVLWPPMPKGAKPLTPVHGVAIYVPPVPPPSESSSADLNVLIEVIARFDPLPPLWVRLRVVDAKTQSLLGMTAAALDDENMEETAR